MRNALLRRCALLYLHRRHGCGLRRGEALAVESSWFQNGKLRVHQQQLSDSSHGPLKSRKPGEFRDVPTTQYVLNAVAGPGDGYLLRLGGLVVRPSGKVRAKGRYVVISYCHSPAPGQGD